MLNCSIGLIELDDKAGPNLGLNFPSPKLDAAMLFPLASKELNCAAVGAFPVYVEEELDSGEKCAFGGAKL